MTLDDAGSYMCNARTPIANVSYVVELTVLGPPDPVGELSSLLEL